MRMKVIRWFSIPSAAICLVWASSLTALDLEFQPGAKKDATRTELDPYFVVHAVHSGIFRPLKLGLSNEQTLEALQFVRENAAFSSASTILVKNYRGSKDLRLGFSFLKAGDMTLFLVVSNYDPKTDEVKDGPVNERFGRSFLVRNSRLVGDEVNDVDGKKEIEFKAARNQLALANLYLLNGKPEDEEQAMKLLLKIEKDILAKPLEKYFAFLTRGQAALIKRDFATAKSVAEDAEKRISGIKAGPDQETARAVLALFHEEFALTKGLTGPRAPGPIRGKQH